MSYTATTQLFRLDPVDIDVHLIALAADILRGGGLVAFPTETVYGLGANALDEQAVERIFSAKGRPANDPIIVHIASQLQLTDVAEAIPDKALELAVKFWPGPLTLVLKKHRQIAPNISAQRDTVAVRMPDHPVALALLMTAGIPIGAPSANRFARPSPTSAQHVLDDLDGRVDVIFDGGPTDIGVESTVLDLSGAQPLVLRPGGVPLEALRRFLPDVEFRPQYLTEAAETPAGPGMLLKHYAPSADVRLFNGDKARVMQVMLDTALHLLGEGQRIGILAPDDEALSFSERFELDPRVRIVALGSDLPQIAAHLFAGMRELDNASVATILVHGFGLEGLGLAIWDRLVRAASGRVIQVD
ncbi:MAG: threonylcarbamoyl-AMP synthase [Chloroflexi bacterium]|nr:threonylcarbamoyl-AMP synthase [Chloroflexota bacterium]